MPPSSHLCGDLVLWENLRIYSLSESTLHPPPTRPISFQPSSIHVSLLLLASVEKSEWQRERERESSSSWLGFHLWVQASVTCQSSDALGQNDVACNTRRFSTRRTQVTAFWFNSLARSVARIQLQWTTDTQMRKRGCIARPYLGENARWFMSNDVTPADPSKVIGAVSFSYNNATRHTHLVTALTSANISAIFCCCVCVLSKQRTIKETANH